MMHQASPFGQGQQNNDESERSLFVGDLASFVTEQHMQEIFRQEGFEIINAKLMRGKQSLSSLSYGFVLMNTKNEAIRAISALDSKLVYGRKLRVKWARPNVKENKNTEFVNSVYVKFQILSPDKFITEETLREIFSYFGIVTDVSVKTSTMNQISGVRDSGYGFVHFQNGTDGVVAAFKAIKAVTANPVIYGVQYTCEASQNLLKNIEIMENMNARRYFDLSSNQQSNQMQTQQGTHHKYSPSQSYGPQTLNSNNNMSHQSPTQPSYYQLQQNNMTNTQVYFNNLNLGSNNNNNSSNNNNNSASYRDQNLRHSGGGSSNADAYSGQQSSVVFSVSNKSVHQSVPSSYLDQNAQSFPYSMSNNGGRDVNTSNVFGFSQLQSSNVGSNSTLGALNSTSSLYETSSDYDVGGRGYTLNQSNNNNGMGGGSNVRPIYRNNPSAGAVTGESTYGNRNVASNAAVVGNAYQMTAVSSTTSGLGNSVQMHAFMSPQIASTAGTVFSKSFPNHLTSTSELSLGTNSDLNIYNGGGGGGGVSARNLGVVGSGVGMMNRGGDVGSNANDGDMKWLTERASQLQLNDSTHSINSLGASNKSLHSQANFSSAISPDTLSGAAAAVANHEIVFTKGVSVDGKSTLFENDSNSALDVYCNSTTSPRTTTSTFSDAAAAAATAAASSQSIRVDVSSILGGGGGRDH